MKRQSQYSEKAISWAYWFFLMPPSCTENDTPFDVAHNHNLTQTLTFTRVS